MSRPARHASPASRWLRLPGPAVLAGLPVLAVLMLVGGPGFAPLYVGMLCLAVLEGFRGERAACPMAGLVAAACFAVVVVRVPFWLAQPTLAWSLVLALALVPCLAHRALSRPLRAGTGDPRTQPPGRPVAAIVEEAGDGPLPGQRLVEPDAIEDAAGSLPDPGPDSTVVAFDDPFVRHRLRVGRLRVLVADDMPSNVAMVRAVLERAGHRVDSVGDGESVLDAMASSDYDAILLDLRMPGISGVEVLHHARVLEARSASTPIIVLSADARPATVAECERAGARALLAKPVSVRALLDALARVGPRAMAAGGAGAEAGEAVSTAMMSELLEIGLGQAFVEGFIEDCARDARACIQGVRHAGGGGDWDGLRDQVQALKGVAGNLGALALVRQASRMLSENDWQLRHGWQVHAAQLDVLLGEAVVALRESLKPAGRRGDPERG